MEKRIPKYMRVLDVFGNPIFVSVAVMETDESVNINLHAINSMQTDNIAVIVINIIVNVSLSSPHFIIFIMLDMNTFLNRFQFELKVLQGLIKIYYNINEIIWRIK